MAYTEQITFLLLLEMADEQTRPPYIRKPIVPTELGWASLLERDGEELERHYRKILDERASLKRASSPGSSGRLMACGKGLAVSLLRWNTGGYRPCTHLPRDLIHPISNGHRFLLTPHHFGIVPAGVQ